MPAASIQLFRLDGHGVRALPAIGAMLEAASQQPSRIALATRSGESPVQLPAANGTLLSQAQTAPNIVVTTQTNAITVQFPGPLPSDFQGPITVRTTNQDGTPGSVQQQINQFTISQDRLSIQLTPTQTIQAGQNLILDFPQVCGQGPCVYPGLPPGSPLAIGFTPTQAILAAGVAAGISTATIIAIFVGVLVATGIVVAVTSSSNNRNSGGGNNPPTPPISQ